MKNVLVTGGAGFIGSHLCDFLLAEKKWKVHCLDAFDNFYNPEIKKQNISASLTNENFVLHQGDIRDTKFLENVFSNHFDVIVHLAARAGVRPSIEQPLLYEDVNIRGTLNLLEKAREKNIRQFVFAGSSSVYGVNPNTPWSEDDFVLKPISPYASTKVAGELTGHTYTHLYGIRFISLRFFTVFGPRQRPDLAIHKFYRLMTENKTIPFFGNGETSRDYTFVGDIVKGIRAAMDYNQSQYEIINLGNSRTVTLKQLISHIENISGHKAILQQLPEQPGDVPHTFANISKAKRLLDYKPETSLEEGLKEFKKWFDSTHETAK
ncbi:MAG: GDP-mannose 4,6-dehydratase [Bacteroidetes bacterium]|jgi:UDP-glucuronate 4-epimerase|nr:GDP-mannose 4,6-dehydratase [Bacteroidota bacterium]